MNSYSIEGHKLLGTIPDAAVEFGFAIGSECPHSSRTISVVDLRRLLETVDADAPIEAYQAAVVDENVLHKDTLSARQKTIGFLRQFYGLSPDVLLFRSLRDLWDVDDSAQPLIAMLCAMARDPVLRTTGDIILGLGHGEPITPDQISGPITDGFPGRFGFKTARSLGQNIASSWQQSGHLSGRAKKTRAQAECRPAAVAYALLLGHLCGARGDGLFDTLWCRLLDVPVSTVRSQAMSASQAGWLEYRHSGQVTEITFNYLMREQEQQ